MITRYNVLFVSEMDTDYDFEYDVENTTEPWTNLTHANKTGGGDHGLSHTSIGFIAAAVAVFFFGSNIVPVKNRDTGDGKWVIQ